MPVRKAHSKSRHGCMQCKTRKVKCGEERPSCSRCRKRRVRCSYDEPATSPMLTPVSNEGQGQRESLPGGVHVEPLATLHSIPLGQPLSTFFRDDFELLHHYTTVTYLTLLDNESSDRVYQINVPQEAARCDFLMHGILAIAAMHLCHLRPESAVHYNRLATQHHSEGLSLFRSNLSQVTKSTAPSVFVFSTFLVCMSLQLLEPNDQQATPYLDTIINTFKLGRGVHDILRLTWDWLLDTPFTPLLFFQERMSACLITLDDEEALDRVEACVREDLVADPKLKDYLDAVQSLRVVYACRSSPTRHKAAIMSWPVTVPVAFYDDLVQREPLAIVILAYYALLLNELRNTWWVGRAGRWLLRDCAGLLSGKHRELVALADKRLN